MGYGGLLRCAGLCAARSRTLLPPASVVFPWLACRRAATLGRSLGSRLGTASKRVGPLGSRRRSGSRAVADLPAELFRRPLSSRCRTAAYDPIRVLPLPAA